jgi:hypothetical protein
MDHPHHVEQEHNEQYRAQPYARTSAISPTPMAIVSATAAQDQQQYYKQYQHRRSTFLVITEPFRASLLLEDLFNLAHFLLDLAAEILGLAFGLQVRAVRGLADCLLDLALYFMKLAFDLIVRALAHLFFSVSVVVVDKGLPLTCPMDGLHSEELAF